MDILNFLGSIPGWIWWMCLWVAAVLSLGAPLLAASTVLMATDPERPRAIDGPLFLWIVTASLSLAMFVTVHDPRMALLGAWSDGYFGLFSKDEGVRTWAFWYARFWTEFVNPTRYDLDGALEQIKHLNYNGLVACGALFVASLTAIAIRGAQLKKFSAIGAGGVFVASAAGWAYLSYLAAAVLLPLAVVAAAVMIVMGILAGFTGSGGR